MSIALESPRADTDSAGRLAQQLRDLPPFEAARTLRDEPADLAVAALTTLAAAKGVEILARLPDDRRAAVLAAAPATVRDQWLLRLSYPEDAVGRLMEPPRATFPAAATVAETTEALRHLVKTAFITYAFVVGPEGKLLGVITFRELLFAQPAQLLSEIMVSNPFALRADAPLLDAMREVVTRHFPVYPVCDGEGRLVGLVRGTTLFEQQAFEISAQAGSMVGVGKEERLGTAWPHSLKMRHPWLQLNLLTAFVAAAVVGIFENTIDQLVVLAVFLPVLAGQSGNTGCQALAVTLRGMTLGELKKGQARVLVAKEALLGSLNGALVGLVAALGMFIYARSVGAENPTMLGLVVMAAMTASCAISGVSGATIPLVLRRFGADPATASSIFLTTATDVASMGIFLGLATLLVL